MHEGMESCLLIQQAFFLPKIHLPFLQYHGLENSHIPVNNKPSHKRFMYDYSYWSVSKNDQHFASQEQVILIISYFNQNSVK
jgi:hypothetical protein